MPRLSYGCVYDYEIFTDSTVKDFTGQIFTIFQKFAAQLL